MPATQGNAEKYHKDYGVYVLQKLNRQVVARTPDGHEIRPGDQLRVTWSTGRVDITEVLPAIHDARNTLELKINGEKAFLSPDGLTAKMWNIYETGITGITGETIGWFESGQDITGSVEVI